MCWLLMTGDPGGLAPRLTLDYAAFDVWVTSGRHWNLNTYAGMHAHVYINSCEHVCMHTTHNFMYTCTKTCAQNCKYFVCIFLSVPTPSPSPLTLFTSLSVLSVCLSVCLSVSLSFSHLESLFTCILYPSKDISELNSAVCWVVNIPSPNQFFPSTLFYSLSLLTLVAVCWVCVSLCLVRGRWAS